MITFDTANSAPLRAGAVAYIVSDRTSGRALRQTLATEDLVNDFKVFLDDLTPGDDAVQ
ncbi:hypothetical protein [Streptomyces sp. NPDC002851]